MISESFKTLEDHLKEDETNLLTQVVDSAELEHAMKREEKVLNQIEEVEDKIFTLKNSGDANILNRKQRKRLIKYLMNSLKKVDRLLVKMSYLDKISSKRVLDEIEKKINRLNSQIAIFKKFVSLRSKKGIVC